MIEKVYLKYCKVLLDDLGDGCGEVTVIGDMRTYSYYWGSMGSPLKEFLMGTSPCYFAGKLIHYDDKEEFDAKGSVQNVRRWIREEMTYDLPWYKFMSGQKELREKLKEIEQTCYSQENFVHQMDGLADSLYCFDLSREDENEFVGIVRDGICNEPWHFIDNKPSKQYIFLEKVLPELQKRFKKEKKVAHVDN